LRRRDQQLEDPVEVLRGDHALREEDLADQAPALAARLLGRLLVQRLEDLRRRREAELDRDVAEEAPADDVFRLLVALARLAEEVGELVRRQHALEEQDLAEEEV